MSDLEDDLRDALDQLYEKDREIESLNRQLKERDKAFEELDGIWRRRLAESTERKKQLGQELAALKHDIERYIKISSEQADEIIAKDDEIARLKKFDVKFSESYDEKFQPVGARYDLLEWQAKLQTELGLLRVRHARLRRELEEARAEIDRQKEAVVFFGSECHRLQTELDEARGMRMKAEFYQSHRTVNLRSNPYCQSCGAVYPLEPQHSWTDEQWIKAAKKD